jgi:hypothetical protein
MVQDKLQRRKLTARGVDESLKAEIATLELRRIRNLFLITTMDLFGNVLSLQNDLVFYPEQKTNGFLL